MKTKLIILVPFILSACASPLDDMLNNQFSIITPTPNNQLVGIWTGSTGPALTTLKINAGGEGISCQSSGASNYSEKIKLAGDTVFDQRGLRQKIKLITDDKLVLSSTYYMSTIEHTYYKDSDLKNASIYCAKELKQQN